MSARRCPEHGMTDCSPLLNGCSRLTGRAETTTEDHDFLPVNGHPDDDECTHRADGTDATYCGEPRTAHDHSAETTTATTEDAEEAFTWAQAARLVGGDVRG